MKFSSITLFLLLFIGMLVNLPGDLPLKFDFFGRQIKFSYQRPRIDLGFINIDFKRDLQLHEGLDLQGGTHLVFEADMKGIGTADKNDALEAVRENIERRINFLGVSEPIIQTAHSGDASRLIVEMAGVKDVKQAISLIGTTAPLDFREMVGTSAAEGFKSSGVTGRDLK